MFSQKFTIKNPTGLHARPAGQLVALCKTIPDALRLITDKGVVNPKNILGILTAGLKNGAEIVVEAEGGSEQQSVEKIIKFLDGLTE
ncbi:HPr family phosphocarrier protein [Butyricicoccus sp. Marseille-Q5471]|uniref:HPr family phosphocarrier protein n=1 Tax=Butyricicoccus sp. Marseille-Q5471 TaxID=3039493 RepID=UPI0024BC6D79|nr:HPr family phosphocarrier protein [Butyricicoccus sp. Marseille-Q5471]